MFFLLFIFKKSPDGEIRAQAIEYVRFVEMKGKYGYSDFKSPS